MPVTMLSTSFGALRHTLHAAGADNPLLQQDTPWISHMAAPKSSQDDSHGDDGGTGPSSAPNPNPAPGGLPPTYASFSPVTLSASTPSRSSRRSTILVHQKSPLLLATPPQITRALAYSHPFLLPLNKAAGLLSWTTNDPWESFLLLCTFWAVVLYGDTVVRAAGPIVLVGSLIVAMYGRRYSPLSSSGWTEPPSKEAAGNGNAHAANGAKGGAGGHHRSGSEVTSTRHQKTLDEIVDTLKEFTGRCNVLLGPALELTDFLSTQRTPTSATTRPALTALFVRILFCTPFWYALTLGPWRIITTRRVVLLLGTLVLTWHARIMRVARTILWRSATVRRTVTAITGLQFEKPVRANAASHEDDIVATTAAEGARHPARRTDSELTKALRKRSHKHGVNATGRDAGVKFTFIIYENQRRWVGLGWTQSLFAYERAAWTDEHNNQVPSKDEFELPEVEDGSRMRWRWVDSSKWRVDGVADDANKEVDYDGEAGKNGWIYYDNKVSPRLSRIHECFDAEQLAVAEWPTRRGRVGSLDQAEKVVSRRRARRGGREHGHRTAGQCATVRRDQQELQHGWREDDESDATVRAWVPPRRGRAAAAAATAGHSLTAFEFSRIARIL
jgi:hypothetical protein